MGKSDKSEAPVCALFPKPHDLRRLRAADLLGAMRIERECFKKTDRSKLKDYLSLLEKGGTAFVIGFPVRAVIWIAHLDKEIVEINSLATLPRHHRRGYADMLLDFAVAHIKESRYSCVMLDVRVSNNGAINLYERHGFKKVKRKKNDYGDEDGWQMCLRL